VPSGFASLVLSAAVGVSAPIPKSPPPDPLGMGFIGFFPQNQTSLIIDRISPNSPAERAGLRPGDQFIRVGKLEPQVFDQLRTYVSGFRPGTVIKLVVKRRGEIKSITLTLGARPSDADYVNPFPLPIDPEP
jgi:S1-C subfamily serine protease